MGSVDWFAVLFVVFGLYMAARSKWFYEKSQEPSWLKSWAGDDGRSLKHGRWFFFFGGLLIASMGVLQLFT
jgi:hypothetical protein